MRVAIVSQSFDVGSGQGVFRAAGDLAANLERAGLDVVRVEAPNLRDLLFYLRVPKLLRGVGANVYHFFMPEYALGLLNSRIASRSVVTIHDCIPLRAPERHWVHTLWSRFTFRLSTRARFIHTPSSFTAEDVQDLLGVPHERIRTIPWGLDIDRFASTRRQRSDDTVVEVAGYLGGFGPRKNVDWILHLAKRFPRVEFRIAGKGRAAENLRSRAQSMGLNNVEFVGFVPEEDLPCFYADLDVFLFPSQYEGFGFPVVEAIAAGVPYIIAGDTGIARDLPVLRVHWFDEFIRMFDSVVRGDMPSLSSELYDVVKKRFNWVAVLERFVSLYSTLLP